MKSLVVFCAIVPIYAVPILGDVHSILQKVEGLLYEECKTKNVTGANLINLFLDKFLNIDNERDSSKTNSEQSVKNAMTAPISFNNGPPSPAGVSAPVTFPAAAQVASSPSPAPSSTAPVAPSPPPISPSPAPVSTVPNVPKSSGTTATLTRFTGSVGQCVTNLRDGMKGVAVNPLLLGFTAEQWVSQFSNARPENIPWCNKKLRVTVRGRTETFDIIDTCDPTGKGGAKCDYNDVIDFYGSYGQQFLQSVVGGEFFQGPVEWQIL